MITDKRGLIASAATPKAIALFDQAIDDMLEYRARTAASIQAAIAEDQNHIMAHVLMTGAMLLMGTNVVRPQIEERLATISALTKEQGGSLTRRENLHVVALNAWASGDLDAACRSWEAIILEWPHDLLALRSLHFQNFWMGRANYMRNMVGAALASWDESMPGYAFVLGMTAFGFEECGDYPRAERLAREAVARNPDDLWSVHAVAHVLEMQGRLAEGSSWLEGPDEQWADRGPFKGHLWWHMALFAVERGDFDRAITIYDVHVQPGEKFVSTDMMNAPSLLARLEFQGADVGDRWNQLAARSEQWIGNHEVPFTDAHTMFPFARTGSPNCDALLRSLEDLARRPKSYGGSIAAPFLVPIARAVRAFYEGRYGETVKILMPLRATLQPIGGSHAQRDLFHQLLTEASIKDGNYRLAKTLLNERITVRPDNTLNYQKMLAVESALSASLH